TGTGSVVQSENAAKNGANMSLDIAQNTSSSGANSAKFNQTNCLTAAASTPVGPVTQTQSSETGGIVPTVNQDTGTAGVNTANAVQTETQCADAHSSGSPSCDTNANQPGYSLKQTQFGPIGNGGAPG